MENALTLAFYLSFVLAFVSAIVFVYCLAKESSDNAIITSLCFVIGFFMTAVLIGTLTYTNVPTSNEHFTSKNGTVFLVGKEAVFCDRVEVYKNPQNAKVQRDLFGNLRVVVP